MDSALFVLRLLLAGVFLVAGVAKLVDLPGSRRAVVDFGLPRSFAGPLGTLLPLIEVGVALLLLPTATAWWGAVGALALLALFVVGIAANMIKGRTPDCHCFGQLHSKPIGWPTLARNVGLAALALLVLWKGDTAPAPGAVTSLATMSGSTYALLIGGAILLALWAVSAWLVFQLLRQNGRLLLRIEAIESQLGLSESALDANTETSEAGLPIGAVAPSFQLPALSGEQVTLDRLRSAGKPVMLLFSDPNCGPCTTMLPELARWQQENAERLTIVPISRGSAELNRAKSDEHGLTNVLLQRERELSEKYESHATPSAVLITADGKIGSRLALGPDEIRGLVTEAGGSSGVLRNRLMNELVIPLNRANGNIRREAPPARPAGLAVGTPAPAVRLPNLIGDLLDLSSFHGHDTMLLFWNPNCGFCQRMLDDLKALEAQPERGRPQILVVSTGTAEMNRALGLRSPIVLDQGFATGHAFGADGTPSAILIDRAGRVASPVVVGAQSVLRLASGAALEISR